ncbi:uncharacterized protein LOC112559613 [Pomacea canaliculata]|uniref:uncharacterized protein LOC112559613 n=1 Tax=Pomacea canaliculata TaxID=400727 RepID=UPI000D735019|nr:uncharacterized protein LOC112559613 [Pomacea canaliculata]
MMIIVPMTTFIVVSLATIVTVVRLRAAMAWRQKSSSSTNSGHTQQTAISKMLVLVSCIYILTTIPWVLLCLTELTLAEFSINGRFYVLYTSMNSVVYYFPYINSSVNIFIYYNRSSRFRRDVQEMFSSCCSQHSTALVCNSTIDVTGQQKPK